MNLDELNFDLPPELIAQRPLAKRDDSRMMLLDRISGKWEDRQFREFPELLRGDELVVFNNATRHSGAVVRQADRDSRHGARSA